MLVGLGKGCGLGGGSLDSRKGLIWRNFTARGVCMSCLNTRSSGRFEAGSLVLRLATPGLSGPVSPTNREI